MLVNLTDVVINIPFKTVNSRCIY